jgi:hypothetical protein
MHATDSMDNIFMLLSTLLALFSYLQDINESVSFAFRETDINPMIRELRIHVVGFKLSSIFVT